MPSTNELYQSYTGKMTRVADVRHASAVLQWDQETYMPAKGAALRGQQLSTLTEIAYQLFAEEELGSILDQLSVANDLDAVQKKNVLLTLEDYEKNKKYSAAFVRKLSEQVNKSFHAWIEARKQNSFGIFEPELEKLIELKKQEADILGYEEHPYDALLNEYEKGATVGLIDKTFGDMLPELKNLLEQIRSKPQVDDSFFSANFPRQQQWDWGMFLIRSMHFDFEAGRQDISEHPFSTSFNPGDVRITTRISESDLANMTWSCIHETGHGLYEQGLPTTEYGLPAGEPCSYSIHESQSRLWENNVGRSLPFWNHYYPHLVKFFPEQFSKTDLQTFYKGLNKVQPSLIRTEADEISYHFHVYIRYEIEKALITGKLRTSEIPDLWNDHYAKLLGVKVPDDKTGCLQDVHWSHGSFGYFPTYSLGSFYAAQFYAAAAESIPDLSKQIASGDTATLLQWLRREIHSKGRQFKSEELCQQVTGKPLNASFFVRYLLEKYREIYNL
jgi:carboxypeptidase Taq